MNAVRPVGHAGCGGVQIEPSFVVSDLLLILEEQVQVGHGLVLHLFDGVAHEVTAEELVRCQRLAFEDESLDFRQCTGPALDHCGVGPTGPEGFFVELDPLFAVFAKYHGAQPSVAHG